MRMSLFFSSSLTWSASIFSGDVQVSLFYLKAPAVGFGDVLVDNSLDLGWVAEVAGIGVQDHTLAFLPLAQDERPGAGRVPR